MYYRNGERSDTCPRVLQKRSQSARETYHPSITDLSEQALRLSNGFGSDEETSIYPLTNGHFGDKPVRLDLTNEDLSSRGDDITNGKVSDINGGNHVNDRSSSRPPSIRIQCMRLPKVPDGSYRERVCLSANNRYKIGAYYRRPRSVEIGRLSSARSPRSIPSGCSDSDMENNNFVPPNFIIRNSCSTSPNNVKSVSNSKKNMDDNQQRPQNKGRQLGTQMSDGCEEKVNGFHQHLVNKHPLLKQRISRWLTNGFKIQSLRSKSVRNLPGDRRPSSERHSWSRGSRRKFSEHNLVEEMRKIKLRQQNITNDVEPCDQNDWALTSSLTITNLSREPSISSQRTISLTNSHE
ncbi:uncharacterized protein LOC132554411 [Ylistrum balloti]|uniref:uncharacterized protein LOC132554411 n=1 Tax=Ylistrum balloti TaxID=509963 RepID=UPI002905E63E|nr:uncharacterized protein LOC132554411 [Ylistrum balloti]